jgi:hypothetical protein
VGSTLTITPKLPLRLSQIVKLIAPVLGCPVDRNWIELPGPVITCGSTGPSLVLIIVSPAPYALFPSLSTNTILLSLHETLVLQVELSLLAQITTVAFRREASLRAACRSALSALACVVSLVLKEGAAKPRRIASIATVTNISTSVNPSGFLMYAPQEKIAVHVHQLLLSIGHSKLQYTPAGSQIATTRR